MSPATFATGAPLVVASHNEGKVREIRALLAPFGLKTLSAAELDLPEPEETGLTFIANAQIKALAAAGTSGFAALADDSGLAVDALGGDPGIRSARWAGDPRDFGVAMARVNDALVEARASTPRQRTARFVCALCLAAPDGTLETFEGTVEGTIVWPPRGSRGFGYDPIFQPTGERLTFGEMEPARKHAMSHRADAFNKLVAHLGEHTEAQ